MISFLHRLKNQIEQGGKNIFVCVNILTETNFLRPSLMCICLHEAVCVGSTDSDKQAHEEARHNCIPSNLTLHQGERTGRVLKSENRGYLVI